MDPVKSKADSLIDHVHDVLQTLIKRLPKNCASLRVMKSPEHEDELKVLDVTPASPAAAKITARVDNGYGVTLSIGYGAVFEVPAKGRRYTDRPCAEEVQAIGSAVINGDFSETFWTKRSNVVRSVATLTVNGRMVPSYWRQMFTNPFIKKVKKQVSYQAYCPGIEVK